MGLLRSTEPRNSLTVRPLALPLGLSILIVPDTGSIKLIILKLAHVSVAFDSLLNSVALHLTIFEFTFISRLVWPDHHSFSTHIIVFERSLVDLSSVGEVVLAVSFELPVNKLSLIMAAIKLKPSSAGLFSIDEITGVDDSSSLPHLFPLAVLFILFPWPLIDRLVSVNKDAMALCFTVFPLTLVDVTVSVGHSSFSVHLLILNLTLV